MATCAVCLTPITSPQRFVIDGTEVLHRACALRQHITILQRAQQDLAAARHAEASAQSRELEYRAKIATLEYLNQKLGSDETDIATVRRDLRVIMRHSAILRTERGQAIAERDAARRELALHQTIAAAPVATAPAADSSAQEALPERPGRDDAETRFSLLELDPL